VKSKIICTILFSVLIFSIILTPQSFGYGGGEPPSTKVCGDKLCSEIPGGRDAATGATLHAVNYRTGEAVWSNPISNYVSGTDARVSPAIHGNLLILGSLITAEGAHKSLPLID